MVGGNVVVVVVKDIRRDDDMLEDGDVICVGGANAAVGEETARSAPAVKRRA